MNLDQRKLWDISPTVSTRSAVFPMDQPLEVTTILDYSKGHTLRLSGGKLTYHLGAHADAHSHYHPDGKSIEHRPLAPYLGPAQVITIPALNAPITLKRFTERCDIGSLRAPRILLRTMSIVDRDKWQTQFETLAPELIEALAQAGVILIGIDTPSIDDSTSKILESHQVVYRNNLSILENLDLSQIQDGIYDLIALPIKIENAEAGWVRAVLLERESTG